MITDGILAYESELYFHAAVAAIMAVVLLVGFFSGRASVNVRKHLDADAQHEITRMERERNEAQTQAAYLNAEVTRLQSTVADLRSARLAALNALQRRE